MRAKKSAQALLVTVGIIGYAGCSVFTGENLTSADNSSSENQFEFSYSVVINHRPSQESIVFDDGDKTYFKVPAGNAISKAYIVDHSGYKQVDLESHFASGAQYRFANQVGKKWVVFFKDGGQMVSTKMEKPKDLASFKKLPKVEDFARDNNAAQNINVKERISYLENKLGGMLGLLKKYSAKSHKAKQILAQINEVAESNQQVAAVDESSSRKTSSENIILESKPEAVGTLVESEKVQEPRKIVVATSATNSEADNIDNVSKNSKEHKAQASEVKDSKSFIAEIGQQVSHFYPGDLNLDMLSNAFNRVATQNVTNKAQPAEVVQQVEQIAESGNSTAKKSIASTANLDVEVASKSEQKAVEQQTTKSVENIFEYADASLVVEKAKESIKEIKNTIQQTLAEKLAEQTGYANFYGNRYKIDIPFAFGYRKIGPKGDSVISNMLGAIDSINNLTRTESIELVGLATEDGNQDRNEWLASERADAVKQALIKNGVKPGLIKTKTREQGEYGLAVKVSVTYKAEMLSQN